MKYKNRFIIRSQIHAVISSLFLDSKLQPVKRDSWNPFQWFHTRFMSLSFKFRKNLKKKTAYVM